MNRTLAFILLATIGWSARAHISLEDPKAYAGTGYKAVLRVTHGCEGSATHTLVVQLPPGFREAKPMPKPGWQIVIRRAPLAQPYDSHGRKISDDVDQITWEATSRETALPDAQYDEFVLRGQAPDKPGAVWFKVRQLCEKGEANWVEIPANGGTSTKGLKEPAVLLEVHPSEHAGHQH